MLVAGAQTLSLLCLSASGDSGGGEPSPSGVAPAAVAAYAAGVEATLAYEAALQRGTATIRCIRIRAIFWRLLPSV